MRGKSDIQAELGLILELEKKIEKRMWDGSSVCKDNKGNPLNEGNINVQVNELADLIVRDYPNHTPVLVSVMDGALPFTTKLLEALNQRQYSYQYTTMQTSSYFGLESGEVKIGSELKIPPAGRHVIIVDDVCDTGKTFDKIRKTLKGALSVELMVLVDKVQAREKDCNPKYLGFEISKDDFIIGMGLDFHGFLRNTSSIHVVNKETLPTDEEKCLINRKEQLSNELIALEDQSNVATKNSFFQLDTEDYVPVATICAIQ